MDTIVQTLTNVNSIPMIAMLLFVVKIRKAVINVMAANLDILELVNHVPTKTNALDPFVKNLKILIA